ncbi:hypothetical protein LWI29_034782 [Acer saccharum]|uniref:Patatin n=1 Tax=Acer saccharum TaxID=4024 RepID=A0AA39TGK6_ACESA|nr:hypothetical protein LWI29_034782 [Acer saccharum]
MAISHAAKDILKYKNRPILDARHMLVLSLGTGESKKEQRYSAAKSSEWGMTTWIYEGGRTPIIDIFSDASSDIVDFHVSTLFQSINCMGNYLRIQEDSLSGDAASVDIATNENLQKLAEIGRNLLKEPVSRIDVDTGRFQNVEGEGTSTDALITTMLATPNKEGKPMFAAKDINNFYFAHLPKIFPQNR